MYGNNYNNRQRNSVHRPPDVRNRTFLRELEGGIVKNVVIGLVISKYEARSFPDKKNYGQMRYQLVFVLRDTAVDFINVICWGQEDFINNTSQSFKVGDVVEIENCMIQTKPTSDYEDKYRPSTASPFQINVSENHSKISQFTGTDLSEFSSIAYIPVKERNDYYTLADIIANGHNLNGAMLNILAVVKDCGSTKDITTRTGRQIKRREVKLFDDTCLSFPLIIWDSEFAEQVDTWTTKETASKYFLELESHKELLDINRQHLYEAHRQEEKSQVELQFMVTHCQRIERQLVRSRQFNEKLKTESKLKDAKVQNLIVIIENLAENIDDTKKLYLFATEENKDIEEKLTRSDEKLQDAEEEIINHVAANVVSDVLHNILEEESRRRIKEHADMEEEPRKIIFPYTDSEKLNKESEEKLAGMTEELAATKLALKEANEEVLNITAAYMSSEALKNVLNENVQSAFVNSEALIDTLDYNVKWSTSGRFDAEKALEDANSQIATLSATNLALETLKVSLKKDMENLQHKLVESEKKYTKLNEQTKTNIAHLQNIVNGGMLSSCGKNDEAVIIPDVSENMDSENKRSVSNESYVENANSEGDGNEIAIHRSMLWNWVDQDEDAFGVVGNVEEGVGMYVGNNIKDNALTDLQKLQYSLLSVFNYWKKKFTHFEMSSRKIESMKKDKTRTDEVIHEGLIALKDRLLRKMRFCGRGFSKKMEIVNLLLEAVEENRGLMET